MGEEWKPVTVHGEPWPYEVSDFGRVRRSASGQPRSHTYIGRLLKPYKTKAGYIQVSIHLNGTRRKAYIHQLVWESFVGQLTPRKQINHVNGTKDDNRLENLEAITNIENQAHSIRNGLNPLTKLTESEVLAIRDEGRDAGNVISGLASRYDVSERTILTILTGKRWKWVS